MKSDLEILIEARALIATPGTWCQGAFQFESPVGRPTRYCVLGAIMAAGGTGPHQAIRCCDTLVHAMGDVARYNDTHTHLEVLTALDCCIAYERARQPKPTDITPFLNILKANAPAAVTA